MTCPSSTVRLAVGLLFVVAGCMDNGSSGSSVIGPVQNLDIVATSDGLAFRIQWDAPFGNPPLDGYRVEFEPNRGVDETLAALTTSTFVVHDPELGIHGTYSVTPVAPDGTEGEAERATRTRTGTHPHAAPSIQDPHAPSAMLTALGIGFRDNDFKEYGLSTLVGDLVALYATNFADGVDLPLYLASADLIQDTPADQSVVPEFDFNGCLIKDLGTGPVDFAPALDNSYTDRAEAIAGHRYAIYDPLEQYYYVVSVLEVGASSGDVRLGTWVRGEFPRSRVIAFSELDELPNDLPARVSWSPNVLVPNEPARILIETPLPLCEVDLAFDLSVSLPIVASALEIVVPAGEFVGSATVTSMTSAVSRIRVVGNGCHSLTALIDLAIHPAGNDLLTGFAGGVSGDAGAVASLDITLEYRDESSPTIFSRFAQWNVVYTESSPANFAANLTAQSQALLSSGLFDGPGGQYSWTLEPFTDAPYSGDLVGTFTLNRPDGTLEIFDYVLPPKDSN